MLNEQQLAEMAARFGASDIGSDNLEVKGQVEKLTSNQEQKEVVKKDVKQTDDIKNDNAGDEGHAVPYNRFKSVNESKKALAKRNSELEKELNSLREREKQWSVKDTSSQSQYQHKSEDNSFASLFEDETDDKWNLLDKRLATFEEKSAFAELERDVGNVRNQYPNVPEQVLLQAIVNNPNVDIAEVARNYDSFTAEIEQRAIANYLKSNPVGKQVQEVARRPQTSGVNSGPQIQGAPKTINAARASALDALKKSGFFG